MIWGLMEMGKKALSLSLSRNEEQRWERERNKERNRDSITKNSIFKAAIDVDLEMCFLEGVFWG